MPAPRWAFFLTIAIGLPTVLTFFSLLHTHPRGDYVDGDQPRSGLGALFSFHTPSSLFPPSAIISLTDDNSTFFLARPADFGASLQSNGFSGQLWAGSGFNDDDTSRGGNNDNLGGELGCSDVPGWDDRHERVAAVDSDKKEPSRGKKDVSGTVKPASGSKAPKRPRSEAGDVRPQEEDGTDDHLHHPLPSSPVTKPVDPADSSQREKESSTHADIQSLQEGAEIAGKIALLKRGGCGFLEKVKWAQRRGATALIVGDNTRGGALVTMYARGDTSNVTIPSVFTSHTTAQLLSSLIPEDESDDSSPEQSSAPKAGIKGKRPGPISRVKSQLRPGRSSPKETEKLKSRWAKVVSALKFTKHSQDSLHSESRRPPSSGRLDVAGDRHSNDLKRDPKDSTTTLPAAASSVAKKNPSKSSAGHSDDFVIGVQDWRDPDMVAAKASSTKSSTTSTAEVPIATEDLLRMGKEAEKQKSTDAALTGGSITPGSGEYSKPGKSEKKNPVQGSKEKSKISSDNGKSSSSKEEGNSGSEEEHEGLWVTITPTAMSTSPFFDTLLVLVVSPLVTLTVVYALLLLRSRIRRRRWRAPKSIVERLPIRTYHTISASSTATSTRFTSPEASSPSSPLLQSTSRPTSSHSRPRSATTSGVSEAVSASLEKASSKASRTQAARGPPKKRKNYQTKHVECVVCLEEYVDGQSRVMSLPCGHEFHVECITPWLTTRRRTCPICKGDVVRSMTQPANKDQSVEGLQNDREVQTRAAETANNSPTAAIPIPRDGPVVEQDEDLAATLVNDDEPRASSSRSPWAGLAAVSLGAFSGQAGDKRDRSDRNR